MLRVEGRLKKSAFGCAQLWLKTIPLRARMTGFDPDCPESRLEAPMKADPPVPNHCCIYYLCESNACVKPMRMRLV